MWTGNLALLPSVTRWLRPGLAAALMVIWAPCPSAAEVETEPVTSAQEALGAAAKVQDPVTTDGLLRIVVWYGKPFLQSAEPPRMDDQSLLSRKRAGTKLAMLMLFDPPLLS
jgi:hypothetical protein